LDPADDLVASSSALASSALKFNPNPFKRSKKKKTSELDRYPHLSISCILFQFIFSYLGEHCAEDSETRDFDLLGWWKNHEQDYPVLANMARDYLAVQASSVPSERVFSSSGLFISDRRTRLSNDTIQASMCLKHWERDSLNL
jgi:hypothetical protein